MKSENRYQISTDTSQFDVALIHEFLGSTYWARNIPRDVVERSIKHSLCFGAFVDGQQVGFARVITDYATFGYIADVFVVPAHRGRGVSKLILRAILQHPQLQGLRRLMLATQDAHRLYAQFGFEPLANPERFVTIHKPNAYQQSAEQSS